MSLRRSRKRWRRSNPMARSSPIIVKLRPLRSADAVSIARFMRTMAADFGGVSRASAADIKRHCFGAQRLASITVATLAGQAVGYIMVRDWMNFDRGAKIRHIQQLYVTAPLRRHGIAQALLQHTAQQALAAGCCRIILDVGKKNPQALRLYQELGFERYRGTLVRHDLPEPALRQLAKHARD